MPGIGAHKGQTSNPLKPPMQGRKRTAGYGPVENACFGSRGTIRLSYQSGISTGYQGESDRLKKNKAFFDSPVMGHPKQEIEFSVYHKTLQRDRTAPKAEEESRLSAPGLCLPTARSYSQSGSLQNSCNASSSSEPCFQPDF